MRSLPQGATLTVAGTAGHDSRPPERDYPALLERLADGRDVRFLGRVADEDLPALYRRSRVFVLPSVNETCYGKRIAIPELLGLSLLEAMASGAPVIASRVGGLPEVIVEGETGFVVEPGDVDEMRGRLEQLLGDDRLARAMGENARQHVVENFTWERLRKAMSGGLRRSDGSRVASERDRRLPGSNRQLCVDRKARGELVVCPTRQHLDRDRLSIGRLDDLEIASGDDCHDLVERRLQDVEIAHHPALVELRTGDHDVQTVVVRMELTLRPLHPRHHVPRLETLRQTDLVDASALLVGECGVHDPLVAAVERLERGGRAFERELVSSECLERELGEQTRHVASPPADGPLRG